jgi:phage recombination protein Bet
MSNIVQQIKGFDRETVELIKRTCATNTSDTELALFLHTASKYNLDPLLHEIWCIKYADKVNIFTSRDGYLKIAHMSGKLDGISSYTIDDEQGNPIKAVCEVYRKDMSKPFRAEVKFKEYFNEKNPTWKKYPSAMLIKVAEVFALRRAFSISGLLTEEEIGTPAPTTPPSYKMTEEEREKVLQIISRFHKDKREKALALLDSLTETQVRRLINNPPFISEEKQIALVNILAEKEIARSDFDNYLKCNYDINNISDITDDIYDTIVSEITVARMV